MVLRAAVILGILSVFPSSLIAQFCVTIQDRPDGGCLETGCSIVCAEPNARIERGGLMPGFFSDYQNGKTVVVGVLPGSPAFQAGIRAGDEFEAVDSKTIPGSGASAWQDAQPHVVRIKRGASIFAKKFGAVSVGVILSHLPVWTDPVKAVSFPSSDQSFVVRPFMTGVLVREDGTGFAVGTVLRGSPADRAGIKPGDRLETSRSVSAYSLEYSNERRFVTVRLRRARTEKILTLSFLSLSEVLDAVAAK